MSQLTVLFDSSHYDSHIVATVSNSEHSWVELPAAPIDVLS